MTEQVELLASLAATFVTYALVVQRIPSRRSHSGPRRPKAWLKPAVQFRSGPTNSVESADRLEAA